MPGHIENRTEREVEMERQINLMRQEHELTIMELAEFKDREANLKRLNETLMKALTQQKPSNALLHEIKLIIEQSGGSDKEKSLQAEIQRLRRDKDKEVEMRVEAILRQGKLSNTNAKCMRCEEYLDKIAKLESELKRINIIIITLNEQKSRLNDQLLRATEDASIIESKKVDLELNLKRMRDNYQSEISKLRTFRNKEQEFLEAQRINKIEAEWRQRLMVVETANKQQMEILRQELQAGYQQFLDNKVNEIANHYEEALQQKIVEINQARQTERQQYFMPASTARRESKLEIDDGGRKASRLTPTKSRLPMENNGCLGNLAAQYAQQEETYKMARPAKSRTVFYGQNQEKQSQIHDEIQSIISGLSKNKQNISQLSAMNSSNINYYGNLPMGSPVNMPMPNAQYCNFSIKDSLNRPNTILESHLRLKRNN